jgi:LacI family transcriptional regulator
MEGQSVKKKAAHRPPVPGAGVDPGGDMTLKDIAEKTGYSIKTVSRAIHNHSDISVETRRKIMKIVEEHSFEPNWAAQSLRSRRTRTIGFVIPNLTNGYFGQIGMVIDAYFRKLGYTTLIGFTSNSYQNEIESLKSLIAKNVDGIIFAPVGCTGGYFRDIPKLNSKPLVIIDNKCQGIDAHYVLHDNAHGVALLVNHLLQHGHRRIGAVIGPVEETSGVERLAGYREALETNGIEIDESLIKISDWEINGGYRATMELFADRAAAPKAVFYANSELILGAYKAFKEMNLGMPSNVAVVSFDAPIVSDALVPYPTTLGYFEEKIGMHAAHLLHEIIGGNEAALPREIRVESRLIMGQSCGCT